MERKQKYFREYYQKNKKTTTKEPVTEEGKERKREYYQKNKQKIKENMEIINRT